MANIQVPTIKLNNGVEMPQVGLGLWKVDKGTCADVVYNAIKEGYRLFDGACGAYISRSSFSNPSLSILTAALVLHNISAWQARFLALFSFCSHGCFKYPLVL